MNIEVLLTQLNETLLLINKNLEIISRKNTNKKIKNLTLKQKNEFIQSFIKESILINDYMVKSLELKEVHKLFKEFCDIKEQKIKIRCLNRYLKNHYNIKDNTVYFNNSSY